MFCVLVPISSGLLPGFVLGSSAEKLMTKYWQPKTVIVYVCCEQWEALKSPENSLEQAPGILHFPLVTARNEHMNVYFCTH